MAARQKNHNPPGRHLLKDLVVPLIIVLLGALLVYVETHWGAAYQHYVQVERENEEIRGMMLENSLLGWQAVDPDTRQKGYETTWKVFSDLSAEDQWSVYTKLLDISISAHGEKYIFYKGAGDNLSGLATQMWLQGWQTVGAYNYRQITRDDSKELTGNNSLGGRIYIKHHLDDGPERIPRDFNEYRKDRAARNHLVALRFFVVNNNWDLPEHLQTYWEWTTSKFQRLGPSRYAEVNKWNPHTELGCGTKHKDRDAR